MVFSRHPSKTIDAKQRQEALIQHCLKDLLPEGDLAQERQRQQELVHETLLLAKQREEEEEEKKEQIRLKQEAHTVALMDITSAVKYKPHESGSVVKDEHADTQNSSKRGLRSITTGVLERLRKQSQDDQNGDSSDNNETSVRSSRSATAGIIGRVLKPGEVDGDSPDKANRLHHLLSPGVLSQLRKSRENVLNSKIGKVSVQGFSLLVSGGGHQEDSIRTSCDANKSEKDMPISERIDLDIASNNTTVTPTSTQHLPPQLSKKMEMFASQLEVARQPRRNTNCDGDEISLGGTLHSIDRSRTIDIVFEPRKTDVKIDSNNPSRLSSLEEEFHPWKSASVQKHLSDQEESRRTRDATEQDKYYEHDDHTVFENSVFGCDCQEDSESNYGEKGIHKDLTEEEKDDSTVFANSTFGAISESKEGFFAQGFLQNEEGFWGDDSGSGVGDDDINSACEEEIDFKLPHTSDGAGKAGREFLHDAAPPVMLVVKETGEREASPFVTSWDPMRSEEDAVIVEQDIEFKESLKGEGKSNRNTTKNAPGKQSMHEMEATLPSSGTEDSEFLNDIDIPLTLDACRKSKTSFNSLDEESSSIGVSKDVLGIGRETKGSHFSEIEKPRSNYGGKTFIPLKADGDSYRSIRTAPTVPSISSPSTSCSSHARITLTRESTSSHSQSDLSPSNNSSRSTRSLSRRGGLRDRRINSCKPNSRSLRNIFDQNSAQKEINPTISIDSPRRRSPEKLRLIDGNGVITKQLRLNGSKDFSGDSNAMGTIIKSNKCSSNTISDSIGTLPLNDDGSADDEVDQRVKKIPNKNTWDDMIENTASRRISRKNMSTSTFRNSWNQLRSQSSSPHRSVRTWQMYGDKFAASKRHLTPNESIDNDIWKDFLDDKDWDLETSSLKSFSSQKKTSLATNASSSSSSLRSGRSIRTWHVGDNSNDAGKVLAQRTSNKKSRDCTKGMKATSTKKKKGAKDQKKNKTSKKKKKKAKDKQTVALEESPRTQPKKVNEQVVEACSAAKPSEISSILKLKGLEKKKKGSSKKEKVKGSKTKSKNRQEQSPVVLVVERALLSNEKHANEKAMEKSNPPIKKKKKTSKKKRQGKTAKSEISKPRQQKNRRRLEIKAMQDH